MLAQKSGSKCLEISAERKHFHFGAHPIKCAFASLTTGVLILVWDVHCFLTTRPTFPNRLLLCATRSLTAHNTTSALARGTGRRRVPASLHRRPGKPRPGKPGAHAQAHRSRHGARTHSATQRNSPNSVPDPRSGGDQGYDTAWDAPGGKCRRQWWRQPWWYPATTLSPRAAALAYSAPCLHLGVKRRRWRTRRPVNAPTSGQSGTSSRWGVEVLFCIHRQMAQRSFL